MVDETLDCLPQKSKFELDLRAVFPGGELPKLDRQFIECTQDPNFSKSSNQSLSVPFIVDGIIGPIYKSGRQAIRAELNEAVKIQLTVMGMRPTTRQVPAGTT